MTIIVQKFGGTSLDTVEKRLHVARHVEETLTFGYNPVVVVSAMGRSGDPYATDSLIALARQANEKINQREYDLLVSCGEVISAVVMAQTLRSTNINAVALTGAQAGIITDDNFGRSSIKSVAPDKLIMLIQAGKVPVVAGFQGISEAGEITTLGRGGSDTTAALLATALNAHSIEIYTDVDGVMTADPRIVADACLVSEVSYREMCELAYKGSKVFHPQATEIASEARIPIKIKSTLKGNSGTIIHNFVHDQPVTAITSRSAIAFVKITLHQEQATVSDLRVFRILADEKISVDFIDIRAQEITFIIDISLRGEVERALAKHKLECEIHQNFAKISVVGAGMTGLPGIMAQVIDCLTRENIQIYQATDSYTSISCLIKKDVEGRALKALHETFGLSAA